MTPSLRRRCASECLGTLFLLAAVVGSGIMAERLSGGNLGLALLANAVATGAALVALISAFAPLSGAHFNPVVTVAMAFADILPWRAVAPYIGAQLLGAVGGVWLAHLMFDVPIWQFSARERSGLGQWAGEFTATFGLLTVIEASRRHFVTSLPGAVAAYITAAYWFTSSTSFANPAVTLARSLTDTFTGIGPNNVAAFVLAQACGAAAAAFSARWFFREAE